MLFQTIEPAPKKPDGVSSEDWKTIKAKGPIRLPAVRARENVKNSKGAYVLQPDAVPVEVKAGISLEIAGMDDQQLKTIVMLSGKRLTKQIKRSDLIRLAQRCIDESTEVVDDGPVDTEADLDEEGEETEGNSGA